MVLRNFSCSYSPSIFLIFHPYVFSEEISVQIFCTFFYWNVFLLMSSQKFYRYPEYKSFIRYVLHKYFLQVCDLSSHFPDSVFQRAKILHFCKVQFMYFFQWIMNQQLSHIGNKSLRVTGYHFKSFALFFN